MTNAEARLNNSLRPRKAEGSLGRTAQDGHLNSHTAPELCLVTPLKGHSFISADVHRVGQRPPKGSLGTNKTVEATTSDRAQELCESRGGRPGLPSLT